MLTPPRAFVALAVIAATMAGVLPVPPLPIAPAAAVVLAPFLPVGSVPVAPGVTHDWGSMTTTKGNQNVDVVTIEPSRPEISFEAALSNDSASALERTTSMAIRRSADGHRVVAAINGDVWAGTANFLENAPNGIHVENGELMVADASQRYAFGFGSDRVPRIGLVHETITMTLADGGAFVISHLNQSPNGGLALFTPRFGPNLSTALTGTEVVISGLALPLTSVGSWSGAVTAVRPAGGGSSIDPGSVVLAAPSSSLALLGLAIGTPVALTTSITPGWEGVTNAVSGRESLVRDGSVFVNPRPTSTFQTHPRSAIGIAADGKVIMLTVDGRRPDISLGVTLEELASLMLANGAVNAINLDGGSSTTLAVRDLGDTDVSLANSPSAGHEIAVTNSIEVVSTVPTGPLAILLVSPPSASLYQQQSVAFRVIALDAAYNPVVLGPGELVWSSDPPLGMIDPSGTFVATTPGTGVVSAQARGVVGTVPIEVLADTSPPVASPPRESPPAGLSIGASVPLSVTWAEASDRGTGVATYEVQLATDRGAWKAVSLPSPMALAVTLGLARNRTYQLRTRAIDRAGNASAWAAGGAFRLAVAQETTRALTLVRGTWSQTSSPSYDRVNARSTRTTGGIARFTFTGTGVAWVAARSPVRGTARVSVDGGPSATIDLYRTSPIARQMVFTRSWTTTGTHTLEIRALGTVGHPRVDIDAFVVLTPAGG